MNINDSPTFPPGPASLPLNMQPSAFTAMVLDDHALVRHAVVSRLTQVAHARVTGDYDCSRRFMAAVLNEAPDVAVIDFSLGPGQIDGLNLIQDVRRRAPRTRILVISAHFDCATVSGAIAAGAHGFLGKSQALNDLIEATRTILRGRQYLHPSMAAEIANMRSRPLHADGPAKGYEELLARARLSLRELEVIRCCLDGMTNIQIANKYVRQTSTISTQKKSALQKLGVNNLSELFKLRYSSER